MERRLLFVAGATPQIVTETVYALCMSEARPPETDVVIITTTVGRERIVRDLLGKGAAWTQLRKAYPKAKRFRLAKENVLLLPAANGAALDDLRTTADSEQAAEFILDLVRKYTGDFEPPLHASIAGGRKTMGYLLASAMILCGRPNDRLSHVLVQPAELESSDFFFPPKGGKVVKVRTAAGTRSVPRSAVRVDLADLPFPRLRLVCNDRSWSKAAFRELVARLQTRLAALLEPAVEIDKGRRRLSCAGQAIKLSPLQLGIYWLIAERRLAHGTRQECPGCEQCFLPAKEIATSFADRLRDLMKSWQSFAVGAGRWGERNFRPEVSHIAAALDQALGEAAKPYAIVRVGDKGERLYGLQLAPAKIRFV